jgi:Carboxypeptidase regulatory-like domain
VRWLAGPPAIVTDPSGAVVANVPVEIKNNETGLARTVTTNAQGEYVAPELAVGVYTVTVRAPNFKESVSKNNLFLVDGANNNDVGSNRTILILEAVS